MRSKTAGLTARLPIGKEAKGDGCSVRLLPLQYRHPQIWRALLARMYKYARDVPIGCSERTMTWPDPTSESLWECQ